MPPRTPSPALLTRLRLVHGAADFICRHVPVPGRTELCRFLARGLLPRFDSPLICPTVFGFDLCVDPRFGTDYYYLGFYEPGTIHAMRRFLRPGDVFVDVGASVGLMTLTASYLVGESGRVLAFEPHPERYQALGASLEANGRSNVRRFQVALSDHAGTASLFTSRPSPSLTAQGSLERFTEVETATLADVLAREGVARVRMVKIDVEGHEAAVLRGGRSLLASADAPIVCFEQGAYPDGVSPFEVLTEANEYQFFRLRRTKQYASSLRRLDPTEVRRGTDNIFALLPSHLQSLPPGTIMGA